MRTCTIDVKLKVKAIEPLCLYSGSMCPSTEPPTIPTATSHTEPNSDYSSPPTHNTPSGTTPEPSFQSACSAMRNIAAQINNNKLFEGLISCTLNECGEINCIMPGGGDLNIILHCSPMAVEIHVGYTDEEFSESESKVFTESGTIENGTVAVTVDNKGDNVLGFAVRYPEGDLTLVSYTQISMKSCSSGTAV